MATIATGSATVGEVINSQVDFLLDGLYREKVARKGTLQRELIANKAARHAIETLRNHLNEVWCGDGNTRFRDVAVPDGNIHEQDL
jgi:hypothetical protein